MKSYDAIIIGAGHNGLAAAVNLASKGWSVAVVEARGTPGGAVKTQELTQPGYSHDFAAMNLSMFAGSAFHARHAADLARHGLAFVPADHCFASIFRDQSWLGVSKDLELTTRRIGALSERDADAWKSLFAAFGSDAAHIFGLLGAPMPSLAAARVVWKAWREKGTSWLYETARMLLASPRDFLDARFEEDKVKTMMAAWGLHLDFTPDTAGGALFPYLESMANQAFGMVIGKGGAATIIHAMTGLLKEKGGTLMLDCPVARIDQDSAGKATGVTLADGEMLQARRAVIANAHPQLVFGKLLKPDASRASFDKKISGFRAGPGTMMVHLALSGLPDWTAGEALKQFAYVHLAPDMQMMSKAYAEAAAGLLPAEPALVVGQPTALDPTRAPEGHHVLWVQVRVLPAEIRGDAAGTISPAGWTSVKEAYADRVLGLIETYAPGFSAKIIGRRVFSPADLERENPNLIGGDNLSGSHHLDQNFLFRPVAGYSRYKTPVANLYLCGASTWPGAGTGAGSGHMLSDMLAR